MRSLSKIEPERVMYYFEEISKIPRCSHDEKRISDYLANFGKELGLEVIQDEALNIIIKKPAYKGYENSPVVVLQGHMDMVCEKIDDSKHDFSKDPIKIEKEDDFLIARETTLGADNGIAVAMAMAVLESKDIPHPRLEVLITTNEESGMTGATNVNPENIEGKILINMDSEEEGTILVSCAGGERNIVTIPIEGKDIDKSKEAYNLIVRGLKGGHSGLEIDEERGNANKIIGRVLYRISRITPIDICHIEGGSKSNAIPRLAKSIILTAKEDECKVKKEIKKIEEELKVELKSKDKDIEVILEKSQENYTRSFSQVETDNVIKALILTPNGVQTMSADIGGLVESSNNLGVVKTRKNSVTMESAMRSSVESLKSLISDEIKLISEMVGGSWESTSSYPAWEYSQESYIREIFKKSYKEINKQDINIAAIHAGLECGLFKEKFKDMDMVSFGPDMFGVHAPGERLSISSTKKSYDLLLNVLGKIK